VSCRKPSKGKAELEAKLEKKGWGPLPNKDEQTAFYLGYRTDLIQHMRTRKLVSMTNTEVKAWLKNTQNSATEDPTLKVGRVHQQRLKAN
jgi:hypothetical protein